MLALNVIFGIVLFVLYIGMMGFMIILERDKPKNMIIWSFVFLVSQVVGYIVYISLRYVFYKKKNSLVIKKAEDEVYDKLISNKIIYKNVTSNDEVFNFTKLAFNANITFNNQYEFIKTYANFKESLLKELSKAKKSIIFEITKFNVKDFEEIKQLLIEKSKDNVDVRIVHERLINYKLKKQLKVNGIKVYRFSKMNTVGKVYANLRNLILIDNNIAYVGNLDVTTKQLTQKYDVANSYIKIKGDVVQDISILLHKDAIFASGKFIKYKSNSHDIKNNTCMQFVSNQCDNNLELVLIKAVCMAKKSIQMQLAQFIPTESIMSLLRFAINSNIEVRLMVPLKNDRRGKYFASRAYAKQLALYGANVYLYDGYIKFNAVTIDDDYVITGSYVVDREHLISSLQNMLLIKDAKAVNFYNRNFEECVNNSYRISNAKYMLLMEKFFKNFV